MQQQMLDTLREHPETARIEARYAQEGVPFEPVFKRITLEVLNNTVGVTPPLRKIVFVIADRLIDYLDEIIVEQAKKEPQGRFWKSWFGRFIRSLFV